VSRSTRSAAVGARMCKPHQCKPYKATGIRGVHWILSGALAAAVRWGWIGVNPAVAKKPAAPASQPQPPVPINDVGTALGLHAGFRGQLLTTVLRLLRIGA
jgi:hypothetical protein